MAKYSANTIKKNLIDKKKRDFAAVKRRCLVQPSWRQRLADECLAAFKERIRRMLDSSVCTHCQRVIP